MSESLSVSYSQRKKRKRTVKQEPLFTEDAYSVEAQCSVVIGMDLHEQKTSASNRLVLVDPLDDPGVS